MPVEITELKITPSDFFTGNPALDVPLTRDERSVLAGRCCASGQSNGVNGVNGSNGVNGH